MAVVIIVKVVYFVNDHIEVGDRCIYIELDFVITKLKSA